MRKLLAVIAGFLSASVVMMAFEFTNSLFFPFPADMNVNDVVQVRAFAASMPLTALVLVAIGWSTGSIIGGAVATRIADHASPALMTGVLLTALGGINAWMIQNPLWFHLGGLPVFMLGVMIGEFAARKRR